MTRLTAALVLALPLLPGCAQTPPQSAPAPATNPDVVSTCQPRYPTRAAITKTDGWVDFRFWLPATGGHPEQVSTEASSHWMFEQVAKDALRCWEFAVPENGARWATQRIVFRME